MTKSFNVGDSVRLVGPGWYDFDGENLVDLRVKIIFVYEDDAYFDYEGAHLFADPKKRSWWQANLHREAT